MTWEEEILKKKGINYEKGNSERKQNMMLPLHPVSKS